MRNDFQEGPTVFMEKEVTGEALLNHPHASQPLSVSQLSAYLKTYVEKGFSWISVCGEISGMKKHASGHTYFAIKDEASVLDAVCWRGTRLEEGMRDGCLVICRGKITTYGGRSKYQMIVESMASVGQGALLMQMEALKKRLMAEGLFEASKKKPLPSFPKCIGLITSPTGAVIQDMWNRFQVRLFCRLILYPVAVQGTQSVGEILKALEYFQSMNPRPDVLILARGGGSVEDLWPFHDEALVRAVAASCIPIISAIGHETDVTLVDHAASLRAPTPTAAAEQVLPLKGDLLEKIGVFFQILHRQSQHRLTLFGLRLGQMHEKMKGLEDIFLRRQQYLDELEYRLDQGLKRAMMICKDQYRVLDQRLTPRILYRYVDHQDKLNHLEKFLYHASSKFLGLLGQKWMQTSRLLEGLSYQQTLKRGFAMVLSQHHRAILSRQEAIQEKDLHLTFWDGAVEVRVQKLSNDLEEPASWK